MRKLWKASFSLFRISLAESLQYRLAALSGVVTSLVWAFVEVTVLTVFFRYGAGAGAAAGLTLAQAVSHIWVRELLLVLTPYSLDQEILDKLNNGDVGVELCRPLNLYWHWFSRDAAKKTAIFLTRGLATFAIGFLIPGGYGARPPVSLAGFLLFLFSMVCSFLLCEAYLMLVTAVRAGIAWGDGPMYFLLQAANVLSGGILALQLWPDFLQPFLLLQPFAGLCDIPARLYIGSMEPGEAWLGIGIQLVWTGIFVLAGRRILAGRLRHIVAQGG